MNEIASFSGQYRFLSNFYQCCVTTDLTYPSSEHAYMAAKCINEKDRHLFLLGTPGQAKRRGQKVQLKKNWHDIRVSVMKEIVTAKFNQNPELAKRLIATGDSVLIEGNTWNDIFWGVCKGHGENHLGVILMQVRADL